MRRNLATFVGKNGSRYFYAPPSCLIEPEMRARLRARDPGKSVFPRIMLAINSPVPQDVPVHVSIANMHKGKA